MQQVVETTENAAVPPPGLVWRWRWRLSRVVCSFVCQGWREDFILRSCNTDSSLDVVAVVVVVCGRLARPGWGRSTGSSCDVVILGGKRNVVLCVFLHDAGRGTFSIVPTPERFAWYLHFHSVFFQCKCQVDAKNTFLLFSKKPASVWTSLTSDLILVRVLYVRIHYESAYTILVLLQSRKNASPSAFHCTHSGSTASCSHADDTRICFCLIFFFPPLAQIASSQQSGKLGCTQLFGQILLEWAMSTWLFYCSPMIPTPAQSPVLNARLVWCLPNLRRPSVSHRMPTMEKKTKMRQPAVATYFWHQTCWIVSTRLVFHHWLATRKMLPFTVQKSICRSLCLGGTTNQKQEARNIGEYMLYIEEQWREVWEVE